MRAILESYKKNKEGKLEIIYSVKSLEGNNFKVKEEEPYSIEREKQLLNELKNNLTDKMDKYTSLRIQNNMLMYNIVNGIGMSMISFFGTKHILGTIGVLDTLKNTKTYLEQYKELIGMEKYIYYLDNENTFNEFNKIGSNINCPIIKNKIKKIDGNIDCHNINLFTKRELKKINNYTNKKI